MKRATEVDRESCVRRFFIFPQLGCGQAIKAARQGNPTRQPDQASQQNASCARARVPVARRGGSQTTMCCTRSALRFSTYAAWQKPARASRLFVSEHSLSLLWAQPHAPSALVAGLHGDADMMRLTPNMVRHAHRLSTRLRERTTAGTQYDDNEEEEPNGHERGIREARPSKPIT